MISAYNKTDIQKYSNTFNEAEVILLNQKQYLLT